MKKQIYLLTALIGILIITIGIYSACSQPRSTSAKVPNGNTLYFDGSKLKESNTEPRYLLVFKTNEVNPYGYSNMQISKTFSDFESLNNELNWSVNGEKHINFSYTTYGNIIGIWDLKELKKLEFTYHSEKKKREREVVIEEHEWEDNYIIIKNNPK